MAVHDHREFGPLFAAFTNADITAEEHSRLRELAERDVARRGAIAEVEALHELVAVERAMRFEIMAPIEAVEEADESYRRLARAAARAGEVLRAHMLHPTLIDPVATAGAPPVPRVSRRRWVVAAAVAAGLLLAVVLGWPRASLRETPALTPGVPDSKVLGGGQGIQVTSQISAAEPEWSWTEVRGAVSYQVALVDRDKAVVLGRTEGRRFTRWRLTPAELVTLRDHGGPLFLTVVARNRAGEVAGQTRAPVRVDLR